MKNKKLLYGLIIIGALLASFRIYFGTTAAGFFMVPVTTELGFSRSAFSMFFSIVPLVGMCTYPFIGRIIKRFGVRAYVLTGGIVCSIGFILLRFCETLIPFYAVSAMIGLFLFGSTSIVAPIVVNNWFVKNRGLVLGLVMSGPSIAGMLLSTTVSSVVVNSGWRNGYVFLAVMMGVFTIICVCLIKDAPQTMGLLPYGYEEEQQNGQSKEQKALDIPGVDFAVAMKSKQYYLSFVTILLLSVVSGVNSHMSAIFTDAGMTAVLTGTLISVYSFGKASARIAMGFLNDKIGLKATMVIIYAGGAIGLLGIAASNNFAMYAASSILVACVGASVGVLPSLTAGQVFGQKDFAMIWSHTNMAGPLGTALSGPIWGAVYDLTGNYKLGLYTGAVVMVIVCILGFLIVKPDPKLAYKK
jgi:MFS family permease